MIIGRQSGLGRGLGALIPPAPKPTPPPPVGTPVAPPMSSYEGDVAGSFVAKTPSGEAEVRRIMDVPIQDIERNPHQPRVHFDHAQLEDLISSIKEHGIIQPLVVTDLGNNRYRLIAGERRLRAALIAGLETVPAIVRKANEQQELEVAIIENVQRQDLNPIEEAKAYVRLMDEFNLTQDEVSTRVGKSRPQVGNLVRLLQLPEKIQLALMERQISPSHARTLLSLPTPEEQLKAFEDMVSGKITVRQAEERIPRTHHRAKIQDANINAAEERLRDALHCRVQVKRDMHGEGEIRLKFFSDEEFQSLMDQLARAQE